MQKYVEKASVLIEALPYIKKFRGKEVLIKYGGAAMQDEKIRTNVLYDLVFMNYVGIKPILIHGGGKSITERLKREGIESRFIDGLRVTDAKTRNVAIEVLESINKSIVQEINRLGARALGLSGHADEILNVRRLRKNKDVGYVGEVVSVNYQPIRELTDLNAIPVIFPSGIDKKKEIYNVNADEAAAKIAAAMQVQKIMILTNVQGVLKNPQDGNSLISTLRASEGESLVRTKVVTEGMIPKLRACMSAVEGGVQKAHIIDGRIKHSLLLEVFTDRGIGTEIIPNNV
jgi:acetylglutamate kinase